MNDNIPTLCCFVKLFQDDYWQMLNALSEKYFQIEKFLIISIPFQNIVMSLCI